MTPRTARIAQGMAAVIAILFGVATLFAGGRVLRGADPGYQVFQPLLVYNTIMGAAYLAAIVLVYRSGGGVAVDSLRAMTLRTTVWLVLFASVSWLVRSRAEA